jgi:hypothetical protein
MERPQPFFILNSVWPRSWIWDLMTLIVHWIDALAKLLENPNGWEGLCYIFQQCGHKPNDDLEFSFIYELFISQRVLHPVANGMFTSVIGSWRQVHLLICFQRGFWSVSLGLLCTSDTIPLILVLIGHPTLMMTICGISFPITIHILVMFLCREIYSVWMLK